MIACNFASKELSFADPDDTGMLDALGWDTEILDLVHNFITDPL